MAAKIKGIKQGGLSGLSAQGLLRLLQGLALLDGLTPDLWHSILFILEGKGLQASPSSSTVPDCLCAELVAACLSAGPPAAPIKESVPGLVPGLRR